jgi:hypothetical protein
LHVAVATLGLRTGVDAVVAVAALDRVVPITGIELIRALAAPHEVGPVRAEELVRARPQDHLPRSERHPHVPAAEHGPGGDLVVGRAGVHDDGLAA